MIVGASFLGDANEKLMWIQHSLYGELLVHLFTSARERYLQARWLVAVEAELAMKVATLNGFDHRVLQGAHDQIAAYYRFAIDPRGQIPLFLGDVTYEQHARTGWRAFFLNEVKRLAEDDDIARTILTAVAYQNTEPGHAAESRLDQLLKERYGPLGDPANRAPSSSCA